jgi:hypothetical protein
MIEFFDEVFLLFKFLLVVEVPVALALAFVFGLVICLCLIFGIGHALWKGDGEIILCFAGILTSPILTGSSVLFLNKKV